jgi:hypothetical protein
MKYKTIKIEEQEYYLIPKVSVSDKVDKCCVEIEVTKTETRRFVYVRVKGIWGNYEPQKGQPWMTYYRDESEDGSFTWYRTCGGWVDARKEDVAILESWYQKTINI